MGTPTHPRLVKVLKRLADEKRLAHGYLFFGSRGSGKGVVAESLAHYLEGGEFSPATRLLNDARTFRPDAPARHASQGDAGGEGKIGIDEARALKLFLYARPNVSAYRLAIVSGAERLTPEAQHALLKVAEEPPASGVLVLVTSEREAIFPTLQSRLHQLYFPSVPGEWPDEARARAFSTEAVQFLTTAPAARKEYIKKLVAPADFNLADFLDQCIIVLGEEIRKGKGGYALWHKALALREHAARGSLNARLQLLALTQNL